MYSSVIVANRFLELAEAKGDKLTPMQLLKLVYIAHGWMLGLYGRPLIREQVEAWQYGPVIPSLYSHVRSYKGSPINGKISSIFARGGELGAEEEDIISQVYEAYGQMPGMRLSRITHAAGTPWSQTYEPGSFGAVIPTDLIEEHYRQLSEQATDE